mmetsp:Transcript_35012/g.100713  ORF Transcript_35012/g.100713 Transcript_35012/m.100713 type:complete len:225 (+) Transcript_35012:97-771(+)
MGNRCTAGKDSQGQPAKNKTPQNKLRKTPQEDMRLSGLIKREPTLQKASRIRRKDIREDYDFEQKVLGTGFSGPVKLAKNKLTGRQYAVKQAWRRQEELTGWMDGWMCCVQAFQQEGCQAGTDRASSQRGRDLFAARPPKHCQVDRDLRGRAARVHGDGVLLGQGALPQALREANVQGARRSRSHQTDAGRHLLPPQPLHRPQGFEVGELAVRERGGRRLPEAD